MRLYVPRSMLQDSHSRLQASGSRFQASSHKLQGPSHRFQAPSSRLWLKATGSGFQALISGSHQECIVVERAAAAFGIRNQIIKIKNTCKHPGQNGFVAKRSSYLNIASVKCAQLQQCSYDL